MVPIRSALTASLMLLTLVGCATGYTPENGPATYWMPQQLRTPLTQTCLVGTRPDWLDPARQVSPEAMGGNAPLIGPGDRLRLHVAGDEDSLTGTYVIDTDGLLVLPGLPPLKLAGLSEAAAQRQVSEALRNEGQVRANPAFADLRMIEFTGKTVTVSGAVFDPGPVRIGERPSEGRVGQREGMASGDDNPERTLGSALRAAGGVRPDADVANVYVVRGDAWTRIDASPIVDASARIDFSIASGDRIVVMSTNCFQPALVRPTAITPPGIRVFMSNLTKPALNNASSAIGKDTTSLPYGTRMLQALVAANCVGGSRMNKDRRGVLISRNPITGKAVVIQRDIEELVRGADRDDLDPYMMPGDGLACYDSRWSNFQDVVGVVGSATGLATTAIVVRNATK